MTAACSLCSSDDTVSLGDVGRYPLLQCRSCGLQFLWPPPGSLELERIYSDYYRSWNLEACAVDVSCMKRCTFEGYLRKVVPLVPSGKLLDVGCATGELLEVARDIGYDVFGVEISPPGIERCRERFGAERISSKQLERSDFPAGFFDIVTLSDVMEHLPDPHGFLDIAAYLLRPGGILLIVTPDTSSWSRSFMGMKWPHYKEEHLYYYNRATITRLLRPAFVPLIVEKATKCLTMRYCRSVTEAYESRSVVSGLIRKSRLLPMGLQNVIFRGGVGEMLVIARKEGRS